jgi:hypothetical protein
VTRRWRRRAHAQGLLSNENVALPQASQDQLDDTAMAMDQEAHEMKELRKDSAKLDDNAIYARPQELRQAESVRPPLSRDAADWAREVRCAREVELS